MDMKKEYDDQFHEIFTCLNCKYQKVIQIDECCRNPMKIVVIDKTMKIDRLLHQCKNCGGIVNKNKPLSFKKYSELIKDEININRLNEWKDIIKFNLQLAKEPVEENNFRLSNFGLLREHYATEKYRNIRKQALIRDNDKCQMCTNCRRSSSFDF